MIIINFVASSPYVLCPCCAGIGGQVLETNQRKYHCLLTSICNTCPNMDNQRNGLETRSILNKNATMSMQLSTYETPFG